MLYLKPNQINFRENFVKKIVFAAGVGFALTIGLLGCEDTSVDGANGVNGENGLNGTSCEVKALPDESGFKVMCGGDSIGVLLNGTSCEVKALSDESGFKVMCGGDSIGVVLNGVKGDSGVGTQGPKGEDGKSCAAEALDDGNGYKIMCDEDSVGVVLNGEPGANGTGYILDRRDNQFYQVVTIGKLTWMTENLNYEAGSGSYCYGSTDEEKAENCATYGRLYTWDVARSVCPQGWHLPEMSEWEALYDAVGDYSMDNNGGMKLKAPMGWETSENSEVGTNDFGFSALPAGYRGKNGEFSYIGKGAYFWTSSVKDNSKVEAVYLVYDDDRAYSGSDEMDVAYSVRCVKGPATDR